MQRRYLLKTTILSSLLILAGCSASLQDEDRAYLDDVRATAQSSAQEAQQSAQQAVDVLNKTNMTRDELLAAIQRVERANAKAELIAAHLEALLNKQLRK